MRQKSFGDFVDKKKRDTIRQLTLVKQMLESKGMKVESFMKSEEDGDGDPYVFCFNPTKNSSFDGIRIYKIGDQLAFRIQKENKTHPYGNAYPLPIEDMFSDFLTDDIDQKKAGKKVIESINKEIRKFFEKSAKAEAEEREFDIDKQSDSAGNVSIKSTGSDYSSLIYNKA